MSNDLYMDGNIIYPAEMAPYFVKQALRTESVYCQINPRVTHAIAGITTEAIEFLGHTDDVNAREEIGDILWYIALLCDELSMNLELLIDHAQGIETEPGESSGIRLVIAAGDLLDLYKKNSFYFKEHSYQHKTTVILAHLHLLCRAFNTTLENEMVRVIEKLRVRYPEKFTREAAENRDLAAERKTLEGSKDEN